jgi:hypothetical protein
VTSADPAPRRLDGKACCLFALAFVLAAALFVVVAAATVLVILWLGGDTNRAGDILARVRPPAAVTAPPPLRRLDETPGTAAPPDSTAETPAATPATVAPRDSAADTPAAGTADQGAATQSATAPPGAGAPAPRAATTSEIPPPPAGALLDPDILAAHPDANISPPFQALRLEDDAAARLRYEGPRLAIGGLTPTWTINFGLVAADSPTTRTLTLANVGTGPLIVPRIHHNCACLSVRVGDISPARDGYLPEPATLAPGETTTVAIAFDPRVPRAYIPGVAAAYFAQLFSNDPRSEQFVAGDANSHEVRLRIVAMVPAATPTPDRPET